MAKDARSTYEVTINGMKHVVLLDAEDAENYGPAAKKISPPPTDPAPPTDPKTEDDELLDSEAPESGRRRR